MRPVPGFEGAGRIILVKSKNRTYYEKNPDCVV